MDTTLPTPTSWPSATATHPARRDIEVTPVADLIRRERRPLPPHDLHGCNARTWAAAVAGAEIKHRERDFNRACHALGVTFDRYADPCCVELGQFDHECHAGAVLNWLGHLQGHDEARHGKWALWKGWTREERVVWLQRRRYLVHGLLRQIWKYKAARREIDRVPTVARAA